ncbi:MAG: hypothetical protein ABWY26_00495, partial [Microbacterium sp.]
PNDETIRLVPALNIGDVEIDEFIQLFTAALRTVEDALVLDASTELSTSATELGTRATELGTGATEEVSA